MRELKWFVKNIGVRVFKDAHKCSCIDCLKASEEGTIIRDKAHAAMMHDDQHKYAVMGFDVNYRKIK